MKRLWTRLRGARGQALSEAALLLFAGASLAATVMYFHADFLLAIQIYMDGFYFVLSLPIP
jgi:hypothetical protein